MTKTTMFLCMTTVLAFWLGLTRQEDPTYALHELSHDQCEALWVNTITDTDLIVYTRHCGERESWNF